MIWQVFCLALCALQQAASARMELHIWRAILEATFHLAGSGSASNTEDAGGRGATGFGALVLRFSLPIPASVR